jgi:hypothetical protein
VIPKQAAAEESGRQSSNRSEVTREEEGEDQDVKTRGRCNAHSMKGMNGPMKKILFALMLALPLSWSFAALAEDAPAAGGDAAKTDADKKPAKKSKKKKKADEKKEEAPKAQ